MNVPSSDPVVLSRSQSVAVGFVSGLRRLTRDKLRGLLVVSDASWKTEASCAGVIIFFAGCAVDWCSVRVTCHPRRPAGGTVLIHITQPISSERRYALCYHHASTWGC